MKYFFYYRDIHARCMQILTLCNCEGIEEQTKLGILKKILNSIENDTIKTTTECLLNEIAGLQKLKQNMITFMNKQEEGKKQFMEENKLKLENEYLKRCEKMHLMDGSNSYKFRDELSKLNPKQTDLIERLEADKTIASYSTISQTRGKITFLSEEDHMIQHSKNIDVLIKQIKSRSREENGKEIILLERKEHGNNLGMRHVKLLANIIKHNQISDNKITIPEKITNSPIYADAMLYNIAIANGVKVIGTEGKGLPEHNSAREEYMSREINKALNMGYNITMPVGASHVDNLRNTLHHKTNFVELTQNNTSHDVMRNNI